MTKNWLATGAHPLTIVNTASPSYAQTTKIPGEHDGLATGAPLTEVI